MEGCSRLLQSDSINIKAHDIMSLICIERRRVYATKNADDNLNEVQCFVNAFNSLLNWVAGGL